MGTITAQVQLTEAELKLLQTLVYQECGMFFDERRSHFLKDRLQRRLKACQLDSFYAYYRLLTSREGRAELALLLENGFLKEIKFLSQSPATRSPSKIRSRGDSPPQAGAPRLHPPGLERWLLRRPGALHRRHFDLRRARLLLPAESASVRDAFAEAAHSPTMESRNRCLGHQLYQLAHRPGRPVYRAADGTCRLHLPAPLFRKSR